MAKGHSEESASAICTTSLQDAGEPIFAAAEHIENARLLHLRGALGTPRTAQLHGRDHLVVPVVALVEGVIHPVNAKTPEFVPLEALSAAPQFWNGRPLVLGHPRNAAGIKSANAPEVLESSGFGQIFNARVEGKRLLMDAFVDPERAERVCGKKFLEDIRAGKMCEVSVGAYVQTSAQEGRHGGRAYTVRWETIAPDHLAFLPDKRGACSVEMGCGANRAAEAPEVYFVTAEGFEPSEGVSMDEKKRTSLIRTFLDKLGLRASAALPDKTQVEVGKSVTINKPGHKSHGKTGKIKSVHGPLIAVAGHGLFKKKEIKAAQEGDTPSEAASEEVAELIGYQAMQTLLDQCGTSYDELDAIIGDLIADEIENPTDTAADEEAEEEVEGARLEAAQSLIFAMQSTLSSVLQITYKLLQPDPAEPVVRYMSGARHSLTDRKIIQDLHDQSVALGADCGMKGAEDDYFERFCRDISQKKREDMPSEDFAGKGTSFPIQKPTDVSAAASSVGRAGSDNYSTDVLKTNIIKIAYRKGDAFVSALPDAWKKKSEQKAAEEHTDRDALIAHLIDCTCSTFTKDDTEMLKAASDEQLQRFVDEAEVNHHEEGDEMTKEETQTLIKSLIEHKHSGFTADDLKMLEAASAPRLEAFKVQADARAQEAEKVKAAEARTLTSEELMKAAPPELKSLLERQQRQETERRTYLVTELKAAQDEYTEAELGAMKLDELERIARVAKVDAPSNTTQVNFSGRMIPRTAEAREKNPHLNPPDPYKAGIEKLRVAQNRTN